MILVCDRGKLRGAERPWQLHSVHWQKKANFFKEIQKGKTQNMAPYFKFQLMINILCTFGVSGHENIIHGLMIKCRKWP